MSIVKILIYRIIATINRVLYKNTKNERSVVFVSFSGKSYSDSPKAISVKLNEMYPNYKQIWCFKEPNNIKNIPSYIKVVRYGSLKMMREMSNSKVWVDNGTKSLWIDKKKNQFFINTWHGGIAIKKIGRDSKHYKSIDLKRDKHSFEMTDLVVSNSKWFTKMITTDFPYTGSIIECGCPRSDVYYNEHIQKNYYYAFREENGISEDTKIFLYAPTFRDDNNPLHYKIQFDKLLKLLENKTNCTWIIAIKLHHYSVSISDEVYDYNEKIINMTNYPDMEKITIASDYFMTDYSSGIFDFALMKKPAFIYADDYLNYSNNERGLNFDIYELPFSCAESEEELFNNIKVFDYAEYQVKLNKFFDRVGLIDKGDASEKVCEIINEIMNEDNA